MFLISEQDVEHLIEPRAAIAAMTESHGRHPVKRSPDIGRLDLKRQQPNGSVLVLAGHSHDRLFAAKNNMHVYPDPHSRHRLARSMMVLWDAVACEPLALIATTAFNNHRTGAALAAAAAKLAPPHAKTLAVFGAGKIAPAAIRYLAVVRPFERIFVLGRGSSRANELAETAASWPGFARCEVAAETDAEKAVGAADVIVTVTTSDVPVFPGAAVKSGSLVILAGANRPDAREADDTLIGRAQIYVDHQEGCMARAGDLAIPLASGHLKARQIIGEIGPVLAGDPVSALAGADVTVFKSIGVIEQDIALGELILRQAQHENVGIDYDPDSGRCRSVSPRRLPATATADNH